MSRTDQAKDMATWAHATNLIKGRHEVAMIEDDEKVQVRDVTVAESLC